MKILSKGPRTYEAYCPKCHSELEYTEYDVKLYQHEFMGDLIDTTRLICPVCEKEFTVKIKIVMGDE